ncbi:MAG: hypothetical protein ABW133_10875, partial [Polyangiaceae bacterium]
MTLRYLQANPHEPPPRSLRFHTEITKLLRGGARCSSTFTCVGKENALAFACVRCDENQRAVTWSRMSRLTDELSADESIATAARCLALSKAPGGGLWAGRKTEESASTRGPIYINMEYQRGFGGLAGRERPP